MKTYSFKSLMLVAALLTVAGMLASFVAAPVGGDRFTISINDKMVVEHYVHFTKDLKTLQLSDASQNDMMTVTYSHCGVTGTSRNLEVRDSKNAVVKGWHFPDGVESSGKTMTIKVRDILALKKGENKKYDLVYSSKELKEGRILASIVIKDDTRASLK